MAPIDIRTRCHREAVPRDTVAIREAHSPRPRDAGLRQAWQGILENPDHYFKAQGRAAERVAVADMGGLKVTDLNKVGGASFPIYDVASRLSVASVKCRGIREAQPSRTTVGNYLHDFDLAVGAIGHPHVFEQAADRLRTLGKDGHEVPSQVTARDTRRAVRALHECAELRIPSNHVGAVQEALRERLLGQNADGNARRYGLHAAAKDYHDQVEHLVRRVKGLSIRSDQVGRLLDVQFGRR
jgi:hypothetical protein